MTKKEKKNQKKRPPRWHETAVLGLASSAAKLAAPVASDALWTHAYVPTATFVKDRINPFLTAGFGGYNIYKAAHPAPPVTHTVTVTQPAQTVTHTQTVTQPAQTVHQTQTPTASGTNSMENQPTIVTFKGPDGTFPTPTPTGADIMNAIPSQPDVVHAKPTAVSGQIEEVN